MLSQVIDKSSYLMVKLLSLAGLFAGQTQWFDGLAKSLGYQSVCHYAVIIDAGSSGSRVLAYKFRVPFTTSRTIFGVSGDLWIGFYISPLQSACDNGRNGQCNLAETSGKVFGPANLDLVDEYFKQSKPGLSSFADDPAKGAETIVQLIKHAEFLIPPEKRSETPLIVRATAGLRLLPSTKAQELIDTVSKAVTCLGYNVASNGVEIMDGADEGIFIWYTINLLHNLMGRETMAALDLGGGSTQITYQLQDEYKKEYPAVDQYIVPAGTNITLYTHSYLNLGLMAARYGVFRLEAQNNASNEFASVCVDPIVQRELWTYANQQYVVSGAPRPDMNRAEIYSCCHKLVKRYVHQTLDWEPTQSPRGNVAAMSYFYDVAADAGIIDVMTGGTVSVNAYRESALTACSASNVEQPWACVDLVYIVTLLQDAYKMRDNQPVSLFKKVDGHEVSWALGLAYTTVMNRIGAEAKLHRTT